MSGIKEVLVVILAKIYRSVEYICKGHALRSVKLTVIAIGLW